MKRLLYFVVLLIVWVLLTLPFDIQNFILGLAVSAVTVLVFGKNFPDISPKYFAPRRILWALWYIPTFLYYMILANLDVLYRVVHPDLPIHPGIVRVKTRLKSPVARLILCNSITLTPGTLTVDIIEDTLYIHWINVKSSDEDRATKLIVNRFEKILERVFE